MNKKTFLFVIIIICSALPIITLSILLYKYAVDIPTGDQWFMLNIFEKHFDKSLSFFDFWDQYTEQRPVVPKLIFFMLGVLTKYNILYEIWLSLFFAFLSYLVFVWHINKNKENFNIKRSYRWLWVFAAFFIFSFSPSSGYTWLTDWVITIQQTALLGLITGAFLLSNYNLTIMPLLGVCLCGMVTTFSTPEGILYWPTVLAILPFKKNTGPKINKIFAMAFWITVSFLVFLAYSINLHRVDCHPSPLFGLHHPVEFVAFIITHIGNPLVAATGRSLRFALPWGVIGLCLFLSISISALRQKSSAMKQGFLFFLMLGVYSLLTAILRAVGRSGFGVDKALACHYAIVGMLLWIAIFFIVYILKVPAHHPNKMMLRSLKIALLSIIFIIICINDIRDINTFITLYVERSYARYAIMTEKDLGYAAYVHHDLKHLAKVEIPRLKRFHFSVFRDNPDKIKELPKCPLMTSPLLSEEYIKKFTKVNDLGLFSIDNVNYGFFENKKDIPTDKNILVKDKDWFTVAGWAVDRNVNNTASEVIITIDNKDYLAYYGVERNDVATYFMNRRYKNSGFHLRLPTDMVPKGAHKISIKIISRDRKYYYEDGPFPFDLT